MLVLKCKDNIMLLSGLSWTFISKKVSKVSKVRYLIYKFFIYRLNILLCVFKIREKHNTVQPR